MDALKQLKLAKNGYIVMSILFMIEMSGLLEKEESNNEKDE